MKRIIITLIIMLFSILPISCLGQAVKTENKNKLTIEDIKAQYTGGEKGEIVSLTNIKEKYILVEFTSDVYMKEFALYDMSTGDKDTLFRGDHSTKLEKIEDENSFVFIADVPNNGNGHKYFPEIIKSCRYQETLDSENDFRLTRQKLYLKVDQGVEMGIKSDESIADIKVTLDGFEVLFEPMQGKEGEFYAAYTSIPVAKTHYHKANNQLIVEFQDTIINKRINTVHINEGNRYISSIDIEKERSNIILKVNLKDTAKYYNIEFSHLDPAIDDFPYLHFDFVSKFNMD